ncbi:MAG: hypothetical protein ACNA8W_00675, partial [Bradymonadaceae bacterium]
NVSRYSRSLIASLRMLNRPIVDPLLFPDATDRERLRLDVFWAQRDRLLRRVDQLIARHGEEAVLFFD